MTGREAQTHAAIRVHWIRVPTPKVGALSIAHLIIGIVVSFVLALLAAFAFAALVRVGFPSDWWVVGIAFIVFPVVGAVLWTWAFARFRQRRFLQETVIRSQRLTSLESHHDAPARLPHRCIERILRRQYWFPRRLTEALRHAGSGRLVVVEDPSGQRYPYPVPLDIDFEPVDVTEDSEQVWHMVWMNLDAQGGEEEQDADMQEDQTTDDGPVRRWKAITWSICKWAFVLFGGSVWLFGLYSVRGSVLPGLLLIPLAVFPLTTLLSNDRWWVVPGGLAYCQDRAWEKGMRVKLFTPDSTPLLMDLRSGTGYLLDGRRLRVFDCAELTRWLVIAGWISRARHPNLDEVREFIGVNERAEPRASARADSTRE